MDVFEKVLFSALMDVMDKVWNEVDADKSVETNNNVVENEVI